MQLTHVENSREREFDFLTLDTLLVSNKLFRSTLRNSPTLKEYSLRSPKRKSHALSYVAAIAPMILAARPR